VLGQVFEELEIAKKENGKLNHIIMNAVLMACVNCKDIDYGLRVFNEMAAPGGTGVDNVTYGTLLKVFHHNPKASWEDVTDCWLYALVVWCREYLFWSIAK